MPTRRQIAMGLGAGLGLAAAAPGAASARRAAPQSTPPTPPQPRVDDPDIAAIDTGYDPNLRMTGPVRVDGRGPFQFVVDTGANRSVIATELAESMGLPAAGQVQLHGIAGVQTVGTARVETFEVGGVVTRNLRMPVLPRRDLGCDGLIGLDALRGRSVELDFNHRTLRIDRSRGVTRTRVAAAGRAPNVAPARYRAGQLTLVDAETDRMRVTAFIDSGAQTTVGNMALRRALRPSAVDFPLGEGPVAIFGVAGQVVYGQVALLRGLKLGGVDLKRMPIVLADLHTFGLWDLADRPALMIGANTLRAFHSVTLDFGRREVVFEL